jgi:hypothetical protein
VIDLPRSTLCSWVADVATALTPIGDQLRREIVATDYLQTDDTTITVLDERGGSYHARHRLNERRAQTRGGSPASAGKTMTAGSARPSFNPLSTFNRWRTLPGISSSHDRGSEHRIGGTQDCADEPGLGARTGRQHERDHGRPRHR